MMTPLNLSDRIRGSLLGGAVGDALGAPIEFMSLAEIRDRFGADGLTDYASAYGRRGAITDDTQMTLFTADGLLRGWVRASERGIGNPLVAIHRAYYRWLLTQGERPPTAINAGRDGWLFQVEDLHSRRAPGMTCLSALREAEDLLSPEIAKNNSKGCGGVMRVAPIGLFASTIGADDRVFDMAAEAAALTHGHPTGFLAAGYLAVMIAAILRGEDVAGGMEAADIYLQSKDGRGEVQRAVDTARELAARGRPSPEDIENLGGGWVAEEALAIAVCAALVARDFTDGVLLAVNHSGDSDSTGAIAGNLLGAQLGVAAIPIAWLDELELRTEIERIACDLEMIGSGRIPSGRAWDGYPGW